MLRQSPINFKYTIFKLTTTDEIRVNNSKYEKRGVDTPQTTNDIL